MAERHYRPRSPDARDPLIVIERKSALEVRLKFRRTAADMPGAIRKLRAQ